MMIQVCFGFKDPFLSLLNLPDQIHAFGNVINYWEGSRERYIQNITPLMKHNRDSMNYLNIQLEILNKHHLFQCFQNQITQKTDVYGLQDSSSTLQFAPLWNTNMILNQYIDVPMHLLFQGIAKSIIDLTFRRMNLHRKLQTYGDFIRPVHLHVKHLQLKCCQMISYRIGGKINTTG